MHGEEHHHSTGEFSSGEAAEKMRENMEKNPEKFPFTAGEKVLVMDPKTGKQTAETFLGFDPKSGKVIVTVEEGGGTRLVEEKNLQKVS